MIYKSFKKVHTTVLSMKKNLPLILHYLLIFSVNLFSTKSQKQPNNFFPLKSLIKPNFNANLTCPKQITHNALRGLTKTNFIASLT